MPVLNLTQFDPNSIKINRIIVVVGKRGSGKTILLQDIVYRIHKRFDVVVALTGTEASREAFREYIPDSFIHHVDVNKVIKTVDLSKTLRKCGKPREFLLILDDFLDQKSILDEDVFREIGYNGRHLNITLVLSLQYMMEMKPHLRSQVDYVFAFHENNLSNRKRLWQYFFGVFDDLESFSRTLEKCTQNHECLVLDNTRYSNKLDQLLYFYRASVNIPQFRVGKPIFWSLTEKYKVPERNLSQKLQEEIMSKINESRIANAMPMSCKKKSSLIIQKVQPKNQFNRSTFY